MTAIKYVGGLIRGTAAERAAYTTTNLRAGWIWIETDTLLIYYWNATAWISIAIGNSSNATFFIYIDTADSNKIKARENSTGLIKYTHATDAGNVFNSVIDDLIATTPAGGSIGVGPGTFNVITSIILKTLVKIVGCGDSTVFFLPNTTNTDIFKSFNFATLTGTNGVGGVAHVVLEDFAIDGNYTNNATAGYGIRKYGYNWKLKNISIRNCRNDGIWSEYTTDTNPLAPWSMEETWNNVKVHHCQGVNIRYRGPHDSRWNNVIGWAGQNGNVVIESSATYDGSVGTSNCHFFSSANDTVNVLITSASVIADHLIAEGTHGTTGTGIKVETGGRLIGSVLVYSNAIGLILNSQDNDVDVWAYVNSVTGIEINSSFNKVRGQSLGATGLIQPTGLHFSNGAGALQGCTIDMKFKQNTTHINWAAAHTNSFVKAHILTDTGETAISGTPGLTTNIVEIFSAGAGTNYVTGNSLLLTLKQTVPSVAAVAELLHQWQVSDDATSYLKIENASSSNAIFIPRVKGLSDLASSSTAFGLEVRGEIRASSDTGVTTPIIIVDGRLHTSAAAVVNRSIFGVRNNGTNVYDFFPSKFLSAKPIQSEDYNDFKIITIPADPATGYIRIYPKAVDANNDGLFIKQKVNGAVVGVRMS